MPGTDIEELKQGGQERCVCNIDDWYVENDPDGVKKILCNKCGKDLLESLIQQKVIEARIDELEAISVSTIRQSAKSGRIGEWVSIDERVKMLEAQLNHNKKGDSNEERN